MTLNYEIPDVGSPNFTEDPKIATALTEIQADVNAMLTTTMTQPSRTLNTAYQPNTARPTLVLATMTTLPMAAVLMWMYVGSTSNPVSSGVVVGEFSYGGSGNFTPQALTFIVPPGWYYECSLQSGMGVPFATTEWAL